VSFGITREFLNSVIPAIVPPSYAIVLSFLSSWLEHIYKSQAEALCKTLGLGTEYSKYISGSAIAAVAVSAFFAALLGFVFSVFWTFRTWPGQWAYWASGITLLLFIVIFLRGSSTILSKHLYEISMEQVKGWSGPKPYTYAQLFKRQQRWFNVILIAIVVGGSYYFSVVQGSTGQKESVAQGSSSPTSSPQGF
jgi:MFS family permease